MKKLIVLLMCMFIVSSLFIGCGTKEKVIDTVEASLESQNDDDNLDSSDNDDKPNEEKQEETFNVTEVSNDIKDQAKKEGVSVNELEETLDGLAELGGIQLGISKEEYIKQVEARGDTILSEWQMVSENMEMSITEIYKYEKIRIESGGGKEEGMDQFTAPEDGNLEVFSEIMEAAAEDAGMEIDTNNSGETVVVTLSDEKLREIFQYNVYEMQEMVTDDLGFGYNYSTKSDYKDICENYRELLMNTEGYLEMKVPQGAGALYMGKINDMNIIISIEAGDDIFVSAYAEK